MFSFNSTHEKLDMRSDVSKRLSINNDDVSVGLTSRKTRQKQWSKELLGLMFANQHG